MSKSFDNTFVATLTGIKQALFPPASDKVLDPSDRIEGKVCLVTGANSGLGFAIATQLAQHGGHIIMAIRSGIPEKGEAIKQKTNNPNIQMEFVELSELESIKDLVLRLQEQGIVIDILVCNAGMVSAGTQTAKNGLDLMFAVNYFSSFYLINLLLKHEVIQAKNDHIPRLIFVSSESHRVNKEIDYNNFGKPAEYNAAQTIKYYGYYKLILNIFINELNRRYANEGKNLSIFSLCPGAVHSNIARQAPAILKPLLWLTFSLFFQSPTKAARPAVYLACSPKLEGETGMYLHMLQEKEMSRRAYSHEEGKKVWEASEELLRELGQHWY